MREISDNPDQSDSVTELMEKLQVGDDSGMQGIWERYFSQLTQLAARKLAGLPQRVRDEEDLALSAMAAMCDGVREGRFRQFASRSDLWQILVVITSRKAIDLRRRQRSRREAGESALGQNVRLDQLLSSPPDATRLEDLQDCCNEMLEGLPEKLKRVAVLKLAGLTHQEIAGELSRSESTVERYVKLIRAHWSESADA